MEKAKKLSVIIPAYKVEQYLERCFVSIDAQDTDSCEFIMVDDGSPDRSGEMLDAFAKERNFVKVIHKQNGGLSDARNAGLQIAEGQYCLFVDSDDTLQPDAIGKILKYLETYSVDVLYLDIQWITQHSTSSYGKRGFPAEIVMTGSKALALELENGRYAAMAQLGVYRTIFLKQNGLYFKKGILHEDEQWSPRVMLAAGRVVRIEYAYYNYYVRENSITQSVNTKRYYDMIDTVRELRNVYSNCGDKTIIRYGKQYLAKLYMNAAAHLLSLDASYKVDPWFYRGCMVGPKNRMKEALFTIFPSVFLKQMEK